MSRAALNALYDCRSDPFTRRVLDDQLLEAGGKPATRLGVALWIVGADAAADAAAADAAADDAADAAAADAAQYAADAADDAASADAAQYAAQYADDAAAADAADDDDTRKRLSKILTGEINMRDGLKVVQVPGRYGYSVTLAGWLRRVVGDEFELHGAVTVARTGGYRMDGLQKLASGGPKKGYDVTEPAKAIEEIHRLVLRRALVADEAAWAKACPKPKDWDARVAV